VSCEPNQCGERRRSKALRFMHPRSPLVVC